MSKFKIENKPKQNENYSEENNYKGMFCGEKIDKNYYEGGAHFSYKDLFTRLSDLKRRDSTSREDPNKYIPKEKKENMIKNTVNSNNNFLYKNAFNQQSNNQKIIGRNNNILPTNINVIKSNGLSINLNKINQCKNPTNLYNNLSFGNYQNKNVNDLFRNAILQKSVDKFPEIIHTKIESNLNTLDILNVISPKNNTKQIEELYLDAASSRNRDENSKMIIVRNTSQKNLNNFNSLNNQKDSLNDIEGKLDGIMKKINNICQDSIIQQSISIKEYTDKKNKLKNDKYINPILKNIPLIGRQGNNFSEVKENSSIQVQMEPVYQNISITKSRNNNNLSHKTSLSYSQYKTPSDIIQKKLVLKNHLNNTILQFPLKSPVKTNFKNNKTKNEFLTLNNSSSANKIFIKTNLNDIKFNDIYYG